MFADVDPESELAQNEVFGPVLAITPFTTEDEAIEIANGTAYGLSAYVQTTDLPPGPPRGRTARHRRSAHQRRPQPRRPPAVRRPRSQRRRQGRRPARHRRVPPHQGRRHPLTVADGIVEVDDVRIRYRSVGSGPVVVFVHGVWVGGALWDDVVRLLPGHRCVVPTWPLGAHRDPSPDADLSALATARRIPQLLETLELDDVTLVGNDTGGGLILGALGTGHPGLDRIGRIVLTNWDSYEHFPPKGFDKLVAMSRAVPPLGRLLLRTFATRVGRRYFLKSVCTSPPTGRAPSRCSRPSPQARPRDGMPFE